MKYRFVFKNGGWWLKISTIEELTDYMEQTKLKNPIAQGFNSAINSKEFGYGMDHVNNAGYLIGLRAEKNNMSLLESALFLALETDNAQIEQLKNGNNIYFNKNGGWHYGKNDYTQWCDKEKLIWPDFKTSQIKIEKFPNGEHFYAYVDNMQIRDGDTLKWNTYEEAYNKALQYINDNK